MNKRNFLFIVIICLALLAAVMAFADETELTLTEVVEKALKRNSRIYQANKDVEISKLNIIRALGIAMPKANVKYEYSHLRFREEQESTFEFGDQSITTTGPQDFDSNIATFNVVQPILSGGRDWVLFFGAFDNIRLLKAVEKRTRQEVVYDVKKAYYQVLSLEKLLDVTKNAKKQMEEHLKVAQANYRQGMVVKTDVLDRKSVV